MTTNTNTALAGAVQAAVSRAAVDHSQYTAFSKPAQYDPNATGRPCASCGERGRWRRWTGKNPGGWFCCSRARREQHGDLSHTCTMACAGGVA